MIAYLLGPSGVGKSTAVQLLRTESKDLDLLDIDAEFIDNEFNWGLIGPRLYRLHRQPTLGRHVVVDIGAGTQTRPQLCAFLREEQALVVLVTASPKEVVLRQPIADRDLAEFVRTEYEERTELYSLATATVDVTGLGKWDAAQRVIDLVKIVMAGQSGIE